MRKYLLVSVLFLALAAIVSGQSTELVASSVQVKEAGENFLVEASIENKGNTSVRTNIRIRPVKPGGLRVYLEPGQNTFTRKVDPDFFPQSR